VLQPHLRPPTAVGSISQKVNQNLAQSTLIQAHILGTSGVSSIWSLASQWNRLTGETSLLIVFSSRYDQVILFSSIRPASILVEDVIDQDSKCSPLRLIPQIFTLRCEMSAVHDLKPGSHSKWVVTHIHFKNSLLARLANSAAFLASLLRFGSPLLIRFLAAQRTLLAAPPSGFKDCGRTLTLLRP